MFIRAAFSNRESSLANTSFFLVNNYGACEQTIAVNDLFILVQQTESRY
jgi:hypothetical protein